MFSLMVVEKSTVSCRTIPICGAKRFLGQIAQIAAIEKDAAGCRIIEARHKAQQRALTRSGATHKGNAFAFRDRSG